jgi:hypothetical protein
MNLYGDHCEPCAFGQTLEADRTARLGVKLAEIEAP